MGATRLAAQGLHTQSTDMTILFGKQTDRGFVEKNNAVVVCGHIAKTKSRCYEFSRFNAYSLRVFHSAEQFACKISTLCRCHISL